MKVKQTKITDYYKSIKSIKIIINRCILCLIDIGDHNPRQYCGKTYCLNDIDFIHEL